MTDAFEMLDIDYDEALDANDKMKRNPRDNRICLCGHPVARHKDWGIGTIRCEPSRMMCRCTSLQPVIEADDTRVFLRKTTGSGAFHALGRGMAAARDKNIEVRWIGTPECSRCKNQGPVSPVAVNDALRIANEDTGKNALLCASCRMEL